jgi:hypothetical protein
MSRRAGLASRRPVAKNGEKVSKMNGRRQCPPIYLSLSLLQTHIQNNNNNNILSGKERKSVQEGKDLWERGGVLLL